MSTNEEMQLIEAVREFAENNLNDPEYLEKFSLEMWEKIADFGLLGITVDEKYGGLGESYRTAAAVFENLGYSCKNNGFVFVVNNHIWVSQNLIYLYGSEQLKDKYLCDMTAGKRIGAICITEAESGSDALSMVTRAEKTDDGYILNGSKAFISNGPIADIFIVFARTGEGNNKSFSAFVVEKEFPGVKIGADIEKMGLGSCPTSEIVFDNCMIPKENVLGRYNFGSLIMTMALEWERCFEFVPHIGAMRRVMERCIEHVRSRQQFGRPIGDYQAVSHKIADMKVGIEMSRAMLDRIVDLKDNMKTAFIDTSIFKLYVSEAYIKTCRDAMQIFGGYGYTKEYDIERELRDALACSIYSGTNEMQKNTIYNFTTNGESL